ncbi:MAG: sigma-54-dependent Fis family transcriptional regulator [Deltaproteobacteria bacterium]|nr:sigma-54-dependent Fis family transcriptional regulator [Deltaproteobacteria bacterium]
MDDFRILFVDDEREILLVVKEYLASHGYHVEVVDSGLRALELFKKKPYEIVFSDLIMPQFSGLDLLEAIKKHRPETEVIIVTGYGTIDTAIKALKLGSYDYLQKPLDLERLRIVIERIMDKRKLERENILIKRRLKQRHKYHDIIGMSPTMQEIYDTIERVSRNDFTVFIQGESGTGKELVARVIHQNSKRKDKPFVPVNCGAIAEGVLESELFGHVKGAFSGAIRDTIGLFKAASEGTIFLDEIVEVAPSLQVKLLRVLQERKVRPVGDTKEMPVDLRVIAASNRDPARAIKEGLLREDLFYRLNVVPIKVPPLRERKEDIPFLANHFLESYYSVNGNHIVNISPDAMDILLNYHWPGNVRQLENVIARTVALGVDKTEITADDLPGELRKGGDGGSVGEPIYNLRKNEAVVIRRALQKAHGNKVEAAKMLGIDASTLYRKMKKCL